MNIVTQADIKKFLMLAKAGIKDGKGKELSIYTSTNRWDGIDVAKDHYISLELRFHIDDDKIRELFVDDDPELSKEIDDLLDRG